MWEAKTALNKAATCDCHTQLLGTASALLVSLFPLGLGTDVSISQGHHWTEAWHSVGAAGVSQFCEVSVMLASPPAELCWSLEELGAFP